MKVGWLFDPYHPDYLGGAELTQAEFRAAAPEGVEVVTCPPGDIDLGCDVYVIHNCMTYPLSDLEQLNDRRVIKYHHDVGPWLPDTVRGWLTDHTEAVCCSPIQAEYLDLDAKLIPPPVDLERFTEAASRVNGDRKGAVSVAAWRNHDKAPHRVAEWAIANDTPVDFHGGGELRPAGSRDVPYDSMPALLAGYETFVFLPTVIEPFGRLVAEAWAAGCKVVTNNLVGSRYWIEEAPDKIDTASEDFWALVTDA
jgi:hypothetical protein